MGIPSAWLNFDHKIVSHGAPGLSSLPNRAAVRLLIKFRGVGPRGETSNKSIFYDVRLGRM